MRPCVRFGEFLRGFGPGIAAAVTRMQQAVQESFFHGFLSYEETKQVENYLSLPLSSLSISSRVSVHASQVHKTDRHPYVGC